MCFISHIKQSNNPLVTIQSIKQIQSTVFKRNPPGLSINNVTHIRNFLFFQVQTVSISYLRCLIEHVRCYILDRDIELVYYTIRKSSDVLTRDPMQLGAQVRRLRTLT